MGITIIVIIINNQLTLFRSLYFRTPIFRDHETLPIKKVCDHFMTRQDTPDLLLPFPCQSLDSQRCMYFLSLGSPPLRPALQSQSRSHFTFQHEIKIHSTIEKLNELLQTELLWTQGLRPTYKKNRYYLQILGP